MTLMKLSTSSLCGGVRLTRTRGCASAQPAHPKRPQLTARAARSSISASHTHFNATKTEVATISSKEGADPSTVSVPKVRARLRPVPLPGSEAPAPQAARVPGKKVADGTTLGGSLHQPARVRTKSLYTGYRRREQLAAQQQAQQIALEKGRDPDSEGVIDYTWEASGHAS